MSSPPKARSFPAGIPSRVDLFLGLAALVLITLAISEQPIRWYLRIGLLAGGAALAIQQAWSSGNLDKVTNTNTPAEKRASRRAIARLAGRLLILLAVSELAVLGWHFLHRDALKYYALQEAVLGRFWPNRGWLIAHITGGITALTLGPFQFWGGLRRRALRLHRALGYCYISSVALAGCASFYLAFRIPDEEGGIRSALSMVVLAAVWMISTALAVRAIFRGQRQRHREWMVRSYVLTFAFVSIRWLTDLPAVLRLGTPEQIVPPIIWVAWSVPLLAAEAIMRWRRAQSA